MIDKESLLNALIENLEEGIHIVDDKGKTIYYNNAMAQMEGQKKEDVMGKEIQEYLVGLCDETSTLIKAIKTKQKTVDVIQHYSSHFGKKVTTINTTIPVTEDDRVIAAIEIAKNLTQLKELNEKLCMIQNEDKMGGKHYNFSDVITQNESMISSVNKAMKASSSKSTVLIYGETGCGKEVLAQSIHYSGIRKDKPFVPINCAAIPSALLEGMLFGTSKGSFTGAENKIGLFEIANGGTVLLDEINSLEPYLQSKLLRVLQDGYIRPIGQVDPINIDIRFIATLNEDPEILISQGRLRKDFYYRLSVVRINIPPLRKRKEDVPLLCKYFISYYNNLLGKSVDGLEEEVLKSFMDYYWPGNVRELKNKIEGAMNMSEGSKLLKEYFEVKSDIRGIPIYTGEKFEDSNQTLDEYISSIESIIINRVLQKYGGNISKAANELGISRQSLQYKIKKYNND